MPVNLKQFDNEKYTEFVTQLAEQHPELREEIRRADNAIQKARQRAQKEKGISSVASPFPFISLSRNAQRTS